MTRAVRNRLLIGLALFVSAVPAHLGATSLVLPSDSSLASAANVIVTARILQSVPLEKEGRIWTETTLAVEERLKGDSADTLTVFEPGGMLNGRASVVFGAPSYSAGERALLFLVLDGRGAYRTAALAAGKFTEGVDRSGVRFWVRNLRDSGLHVVDASSSRDPGLEREAARFEAWLRTGEGDIRSCFLPFDEPDGDVEAQFATFVEPQVHRWFSFDEGTPATWRSVGTQAGFEDGGSRELTRALGLWSGCAGARIDYRPQGGAIAAAPAPSNEVLFDDPHGDIAGSWNGHDGVVAVGGFDAVAAPRPWTSAFEADPAHPAGSFEAWMIVRGRVVVQDGVTPARGIPSATLAEILTHELGHTLGLGHSTDPRALMYPQLQKFGAYLREDDRLAARWLYPGDETIEPDALTAPTNLHVASATSDLVQLRWNDNASGEAFQTIYVSAGGGPFTRLRDVGPDVLVANISDLTPGKGYAFQVTARTPDAESSGSNIAETVVPRPALDARLAVGPPSGTAGITTFSFYDQSKGFVVSRSWTFGDGGASAAVNPTHVYDAAGTFEVALRIRDDRGDERVFTRTVLVAPAPPLLAGFSWTVGPVVASPVQFVDRTSGVPTSWTWDFGDGTGSTERDPVKVFTQPGRYAVSLDVQRGSERAHLVREVTVGHAVRATSSNGF